MTSPDPRLAALRALATAADAIDPAAPDRWSTIYYAYPGCPDGKEVRVAVAYCREWAEWIAATAPSKLAWLLDALAAAEGERDAEAAARSELYAEAKRVQAERDALAARLAGMEGRLRYIANADLSYEPDLRIQAERMREQAMAALPSEAGGEEAS